MIQASETLLGILITISGDPLLLFLCWIFFLVLSYSWSGMAKFISLILFPGRILHISTHYAFSRLLNVKTYMILNTKSFSDTMRMGIILDPNTRWRGTITVLSPMITAVIFSFVLGKTLDWFILARDKTEIIVLAWLTISFFVLGMPDIGDLEAIFTQPVLRNPLLIIALLWTPAIYFLGTIAYSSTTAIYIALLYVFATIITATIPKKRDIPIIE